MCVVWRLLALQHFESLLLVSPFLCVHVYLPMSAIFLSTYRSVCLPVCLSSRPSAPQFHCLSLNVCFWCMYYVSLNVWVWRVCVCVCVCVCPPGLHSYASLQQRLWSSPLSRCHVPKTLRQHTDTQRADSILGRGRRVWRGACLH